MSLWSPTFNYRRDTLDSLSLRSFPDLDMRTVRLPANVIERSAHQPGGRRRKAATQ